MLFIMAANGIIDCQKYKFKKNVIFSFHRMPHVLTKYSPDQKAMILVDGISIHKGLNVT